MDSFETLRDKLRQADIFGYRQKQFETCSTIWQTLVPQSGQAESLQGELLREMEKIRYEACVNGNKNWDTQYAWACGNVYERLAASGLFDAERLSLLRVALDFLQAHGEYAKAFNEGDIGREDADASRLAYTGEDVYDFIEDYIAEFYIANQDLIPYQKHSPSADA